MPRYKNIRAQATTELALLIPIFIFLMISFVKLYDTNLSISNESTQTHVERLDKFDHGDGVIFDPLYGGEVDAGQYTEFVPGSGLLDLDNVLQMATQMAASIVGNRLLDALFSKFDFFQQSTILSDAIQGFSTSALNSYINSGFTEVDLEGAAWDGATAGLSSQQATGYFQGDTARSAREFVGSGLQSAATSFTSSQGDEQALLGGFVNGLMTSDSFGSWVDQKNDGGELVDRKGLEGILMGAAGGAISSTATGIVQGNFDMKQIAQGAAFGAISSKAMADVVTSNNYTGDPRGSVTYGMFNGAASTLISGGNVKDAAFSAANGAFYSQQVQGKFGDKKFLSAASGIAFESGISLAQGSSLESVGYGALASAGGFVMGEASSWAGNKMTQAVDNAKNNRDLKKAAKLNEQQIVEGLEEHTTETEQAYENGYIYASILGSEGHSPTGGNPIVEGGL